jgi:hypothetical protein
MQSSDPKAPPDLTAVISYDVLGAGPGNSSFQQLGITATTVTIDSLVPGDWGVTVNGNNSKGVQIESASVRVMVVAGETVSTDVAVSSFVGDGTFEMYMEWPESIAISPATVALTSQGGASQEITLPAVVTENGVSSVHAATAFAAGYYTLSLSYVDSAGFTWGGAEAVHISSGSTTKLVFTPFENIKMTIVPDISKNTTITFDGQRSILGQGASMTVTATPSGKVNSYQWYLNGLLLVGETAPATTLLRKSLSPGFYRLDVVVSAQGVLSSDHVLFSAP